MIRIRLAILALALLTAVTASAQPPAQTDVTGDWDITINSPQGANTSKVTLKQDAEKLDGLFKSPAGELAFKGTVDGDEVKFTFTINFQGMPLDVRMNGKVAGDTIAGKADFGGFAEGDWTAKRADATAATTAPAAATTSAPAAATTSDPASSAAVGTGFGGKWDVTLKTPAGDFPASATLAEDAGKLSGTFGSQLGEAPVMGTIDGKAMKLTLTAQTPQGPMTVVLTGDLDGDAIVNGKAEVTGMGQMEWSAKRIKP
ncbi:MAG TPA: hypothetical protein VKD69_27010 [Vicinamibacterales bacterium]|nr:hypothetical protein [Vicinamibacterales bacterium]